MYNGESQKVTLLPSDPSAKNVKINFQSSHGNGMGEIPANITTGSDHEGWQIMVTDPCYEPSTINLKRSIAPIYWANIINIIGFPIDYFDGMLWKYDPVQTIPTIKKASCPN